MSNDTFAPASGQHTTDGTPNGYSSITPFLALEDAAGALDFYRDLFGARVVNCTRFGEMVAHAELEFANGRLQLGAASPNYGLVAPDRSSDSVSTSFAVYVPNTDEVVARAVEAGAVLREAPMTFVSGDRFASIRDPFGIRWTIQTRVEDLSDEESATRVEAWAAEQQS